jgi:hypothetical protein
MRKILLGRNGRPDKSPADENAFTKNLNQLGVRAVTLGFACFRVLVSENFCFTERGGQSRANVGTREAS